MGRGRVAWLDGSLAGAEQSPGSSLVLAPTRCPSRPLRRSPTLSSWRQTCSGQLVWPRRPRPSDHSPQCASSTPPPDLQMERWSRPAAGAGCTAPSPVTSGTSDSASDVPAPPSWPSGRPYMSFSTQIWTMNVCCLAFPTHDCKRVMQTLLLAINKGAEGSSAWDCCAFSSKRIFHKAETADHSFGPKSL